MTDNKIDQQREHFDSISDVYFGARRHSNHLLLKSLIWSNFLSGHPQLLSRGSAVLEPMCGMAEGLQIIRDYIRPDFSYLGFDYSEKMVEIAKNQFPGMRILWADVTRFDANGEKFDLIILIGGLHHVYKLSDQVVKSLVQSLKPGGKFINFEPTQNCWLTRKIRERIYKQNDLFDDETEQGFDLADLDNIFVQAGMQKVDQVYPGLLSYVLYYNPDAFPRLNLGGNTAVRATFALDQLLWRTRLARKLSFSTLTLWQK